MIKQADVLLAMFLLGDAFPTETKKRNFDFYDPLTTGDSSLSSCVEAIIAAQTGDMDKAIRYGMAALLMDLADVGGNVRDGCHIASMGGTWMMLTYGFGGMRDSDEMLSFWPRRAPEENAIIRFPLVYRARCWKLGSVWTPWSISCAKVNALWSAMKERDRVNSGKSGRGPAD